MKPFLKWAGGKRWLAQKCPDLFPRAFRRYVEPFLGSGAIFFHLAPSRSLLSDINSALMNVYNCIRLDPHRVYALLKGHARRHGKAYYYSVRDTQYRNEFARAAQFLYLNRTCWNGLYRENLRGQFNVPKGTKDTVLFDDDDFFGASIMLAGATLLSGDFEKVVRQTREGDFVFIDPPYTVRHNGNGFVKYNEKIFSWSDQIRLAKALQDKARCGATYLVTNAYHPSVIDMYEGFGTIVPVKRASVLSADSRFRGSVHEALILIGEKWREIEAPTSLKKALARTSVPTGTPIAP